MGTDTPSEVYCKRIRIQSALQLVVAAAFWTWALFNTINTSFDGGLISFMTVIVTGIIGLISTCMKESIATRMSRWYLIATPISHIIVTLNYIIGALLGSGKTFVAYCWAAAFLWCLSGIIFSIIALQWKRALNVNETTYIRTD